MYCLIQLLQSAAPIGRLLSGILLVPSVGSWGDFGASGDQDHLVEAGGRGCARGRPRASGTIATIRSRRVTEACWPGCNGKFALKYPPNEYGWGTCATSTWQAMFGYFSQQSRNRGFFPPLQNLAGCGYLHYDLG